MKGPNLLRIVAAALALSTLSFAAGVAGDLTLADGPRHGTRVVVRIPPELPADTPRAAPIALISTPAAQASVAPRRTAGVVRSVEALEKPEAEFSVSMEAKINLDLAPKV